MVDGGERGTWPNSIFLSWKAEAIGTPSLWSSPSGPTQCLAFETIVLTIQVRDPKPNFSLPSSKTRGLQVDQLQWGWHPRPHCGRALRTWLYVWLLKWLWGPSVQTCLSNFLSSKALALGVQPLQGWPIHCGWAISMNCVNYMSLHVKFQLVTSRNGEVCSASTWCEYRTSPIQMTFCIRTWRSLL